MHAPHLLSPAGEAALQQLLAGRPLLAFDLDGTLAPIVARPHDARIPLAMARRLQRLAQRRPVAIVTGRRAADARLRLGFEPACVIGSHGAEDDHDPEADCRHSAELDGARALLAQHGPALDQAGVTVEDKGQSIALHHRLAPQPARAAQALRELLAALRRAEPGVQVFGGKRVVNLAGATAPDKAQAVQRLVQRLGADRAFFAGDDVNDEPVFRAAPPHWLTVRVGPAEPASQARFTVAGTAELVRVVDRMLALIGP